MFKKMLVRGTVLVLGTIVSQMVIERLEKASLNRKTGSVVVEFKKKEDGDDNHNIKEVEEKLAKIKKAEEESEGEILAREK